MLRTRGARRWGRRTAAATITSVGLGLLLGLNSGAAARTLPSTCLPLSVLPCVDTPAPLPISVTPAPTVSLPIATPRIPLPIATPTLPISPPTSISGVPPAAGTLVPGQPITGLPQSFQPPGSPFAPGGSTGTGVGSPLTPDQVQTSVLGALLGLVGTPANVGVEQPSLEHFSVGSAAASGRLGPAAASGARRAASPPTVVWALIFAVLLGLLGLGMARQHRRRLSRLRAAATAPLIVLGIVMTVAAARATLSPSAPAAPNVTIAVANAASHSTAVPAVPAGSALFNRVVAFETTIAQTEAQLQSPPANQGAAVLRLERDLALSLEATLQKEYNFFASTARDPAQAAALVRASATQPPSVRNAVTYDVEAVRAQLAQQAAITLAAARNSTIVNPPASGLPAAPSTASSSLRWPMNGVVTQGFGPNNFAIEPAVTLAGISYPHFHTGIDIASAFGTPVQASADGVVALAGAETDGFGHLVGYGNYVVIAHGGNMVTLYGHLEQLLVHAGEAVHAGDPIGLEGSTGNSTGPHVHFELRIDGIPTNPAAYIPSR